MDKNKVVYFAVTSILLFLLYTALSYVPFVSLFLPFLIVGLSCAVTNKTNYKYGITTLLLSFVYFSFVLKFNLENIVSATLYLMLGIIISELVDRKSNKSTLLLVTAIVFIGIYASLFVYQSAKVGHNIFVTEINKFIDEYIVFLTNSLKTTELSENVSVVEQYVRNMANMTINLFPSMIIIGSAVVSYVVLCFSSLFMKIYKCKNQFIPHFSTFKIDTVTSFVYFVSVIMSVFLNNEILLIVFMNIYTIIQFSLIVCGFSIFDFLEFLQPDFVLKW